MKAIEYLHILFKTQTHRSYNNEERHKIIQTHELIDKMTGLVYDDYNIQLIK